MTAPFLARRPRRGPPARGDRRLSPPPTTTLIPPAMILALALLLCAPCITAGDRIGGGAAKRPPFGAASFGRRRSPPLFARSRPSSLSRSISLSSAMSLPRGGGFGDRLPLLGRRRRKRRDGREKGGGGGGDDGDGDDEGRTLYPPLTRDEIEEKLNLPAYCVTDAEGSGIAVMGQKGGAEGMQGAESDGGSGGGCVYLFLSRAMADEALRLAKEANGHLEGLKVSALHLGKVWFRLLHNDDVSVSMKPDNGPEISRRVRFRLVPGARDLVASRVMLGLNAEEAQALRVALEPSPAGDGDDGHLVPSDIDGARSIIERAARNSPAFKTPFDEVPVFLMPRMRVSRPEDGEGQGMGGASRSTPKLPLFLSSKNMVKTFLDMAKENPEILSSVATAPGFGLEGGGGGGISGGNEGPVVQLVELNRIVEMMQEESEMDFRNVVILPPVEDDEDGTRSNEEDDSDDDDDDDGDGGDFGVSAGATDYGRSYDEAEFSPFVSMEVSVLGEGQELVPMH